MSKQNRKRHSADFKAKVALEALKEREPLSELAKRFSLQPAQISQWKKQLHEQSATVFSKEEKKKENKDQQLIDQLYRTIGQYRVELDWLKKKSGQ